MPAELEDVELAALRSNSFDPEAEYSAAEEGDSLPVAEVAKGWLRQAVFGLIRRTVRRVLDTTVRILDARIVLDLRRLRGRREELPLHAPPPAKQPPPPAATPRFAMVR